MKEPKTNTCCRIELKAYFPRKEEESADDINDVVIFVVLSRLCKRILCLYAYLFRRFCLPSVTETSECRKPSRMCFLL